jgi:hypothetical protein
MVYNALRYVPVHTIFRLLRAAGSHANLSQGC